MYNIVFYEDKNGFSELNDELMELAKKADSMLEYSLSK